VVVDGRYPMGNLWGAGADLSFFRSGTAGVYLVGGFEGGVETRGSKSFWTSWSAGLGYELFPIRGLSLAAEGRYRHIGPGDYHGVEVGLRLGLDRGSRRSSGSRGDAGGSPGQLASTAAASDVTPDAEAVREELGRDGVTADRATLISAVVQTALDVMGMPYRWGDEGDEGFDCSGLIRYAFGRHGITVPRRSADQAKEGTEVGRDLDALRPGDVLTFATSGRQVSHVGLYLGNGRFIHSARQGVQISVLSPEDVSGRWWFRRWIGARRIVG
jgi:cell wall-associated NlpC family hydrolase